MSLWASPPRWASLTPPNHWWADYQENQGPGPTFSSKNFLLNLASVGGTFLLRSWYHFLTTCPLQQAWILEHRCLTWRTQDGLDRYFKTGGRPWGGSGQGGRQNPSFPENESPAGAAAGYVVGRGTDPSYLVAHFILKSRAPSWITLVWYWFFLQRGQVFLFVNFSKAWRHAWRRTFHLKFYEQLLINNILTPNVIIVFFSLIIRDSPVWIMKGRRFIRC